MRPHKNMGSPTWRSPAGRYVTGPHRGPFDPVAMGFARLQSIRLSIDRNAPYPRFVDNLANRITIRGVSASSARGELHGGLQEFTTQRLDRDVGPAQQAPSGMLRRFRRSHAKPGRAGVAGRQVRKRLLPRSTVRAEQDVVPHGASSKRESSLAELTHSQFRNPHLGACAWGRRIRDGAPRSYAFRGLQISGTGSNGVQLASTGRIIRARAIRALPCSNGFHQERAVRPESLPNLRE